MGCWRQRRGDGHLGQRDPAPHLSDSYLPKPGRAMHCMPGPTKPASSEAQRQKTREGRCDLPPPRREELRRGCGRLGFYRPPGNPTGSFLLYIWKESDRHHKLRRSSFLTFLVVAKGKVYIEMSRIHNHFPAAEVGSLRCLSLDLGLALPRSLCWEQPSGC